MFRAYFFKSNFWLSLLLILIIIKNPLFILFNFANIEIQNYYYYSYLILLAMIIFTIVFVKKHRGMMLRGLKTSLPITCLVLLGCLLTGAHKEIDESFGVLFFFMLIPFNLIQFFQKPFNIKLFLYTSILVHYIIGLVVSYIFYITGLGYGADGMLASYSISLPSSCILYLAIVESRKNKQLLYVLASFFGLYLTFQAGSRGALIPFMFAFFLGLVNKGVDRMKISLLLLLLIILYETSSYWMGLFSESRVVEAFSDGTLTSTSDRRQETWGPVINAIFRSPIFGWGCFSDRLFTMDNQWAHNLFLEVTCDFGFPIGIYFLSFLVIFVYKVCIKKHNRTIAVLFILSIPQLLVSSSYLLSTYFWVFFGFVVFWYKNSSYFIYDNENLKINK